MESGVGCRSPRNGVWVQPASVSFRELVQQASYLSFNADVRNFDNVIYRHTYYTGAKGLLFVIDSTDVDRMNLAKKELHKMVAHEDLVGCKILIFANKQDAKGALPVAEISKRLNLSVLQGKSYHIQDCCALTGEGLYDGMEWMSNQIRTR